MWKVMEETVEKMKNKQGSFRKHLVIDKNALTDETELAKMK